MIEIPSKQIEIIEKLGDKNKIKNELNKRKKQWKKQRKQK
jgi:hypothetical protein